MRTEEVVTTTTIHTVVCCTRTVRSCLPSNYPPPQAIDTDGVDLDNDGNPVPDNVIPLRRAG